MRLIKGREGKGRGSEKGEERKEVGEIGDG